jgi:hypothetical protein
MAPLYAEVISPMHDKSIVPPNDSAMIYDKNVWRLELTGPFPIKNRVSKLSVEHLTDQERVRSSVRLIIYEALPATLVNSTVMDQRSNEKRPIRLDVSEVLNVTFNLIVEEASHIIALEVGNRLITEILHGVERGRRDLYLRRLSEMLSEKIIDLASNPLFADDPLLREIGVAAVPLYSHHIHNPSSELASRLMSRSSRLLSGKLPFPAVSHTYMTARGGIMSRVLIGLLGVSFFLAHEYGMTWSDMCSHIKRKIISDLISSQSESRKINLLFKFLFNYRKHYNPPPRQKNLIDKILSGSQFCIIDGDHGLDKRLARTLKNPHTTTRNKSTVSLLLTSFLSDLKRSTTLKSERLCVFSPAVAEKFGWSTISPPCLKSVHVGVWMLVMSSISPKRLLSIGVGNGVMVAASLSTGTEKIQGCDLLSRYNLRAVTSNLPVPAVSNHEGRNKFRWSNLMYLCEGDLYHKDFLHVCVSVTESDELVAIDIQPNMTISLLEKISVLLMPHRAVLIRWFIDSQNDSEVKLANAASAIATYEWRLTLGTKIQLFTLHLPDSSNNIPRDPFLQCPDSFSFSKNFWLSQKPAITTSLAVDIGGTDCDDFTIESSLRRFLSLTGRSMVRDDYRTWTGILLKILILQVLSDYSTIDSWLEDYSITREEITVNLPRTKVLLPRSKRLDKMIRMYIIPVVCLYKRTGEKIL